MLDQSASIPLMVPSPDEDYLEDNDRFYSGRRETRNSWQWNAIIRMITRKRLKFYLISAALFIILVMTMIHKSIISSNSHVEETEHKNHNEYVQQKIQLRGHRLRMSRIKTVVGRYVGPTPSWADPSKQNVTQELLNTNNYDPDPEVGQNGKPAYFPGYPQDQMRILFSINRFNLVASDKISVDRKLPDPRKLACRKDIYNLDKLHNTSVIIVFHNEAWSTLARTVHSILNTAPKQLLAEIILVDDASNRTFLGKSLDYYMNNLGSVRGVDIRILRSRERIGLIKARLLGVRKAHGRVLTFIDAHCEATRGWLEPLLEQVSLDRTVAACPIIDIINEDTFAFTRSFELHIGAINWELNFRWYPISRNELVSSNGYYTRTDKTAKSSKVTELVKPFRTPIMAGGLFSIDREYFNEIGTYDWEMDIWGGENIELSLRLWQCGGQVKIVPCSHVAHIFRKSSPYTFRDGKEVSDILYTNLARVAEVWMDDWKYFFRKLNPIVERTELKVGREKVMANISDRKRLREQLQCKNFEWFLDNVWPEHFFPKSDRFFGKLRQSNSKRCLQRPLVRYSSNQATVGAIETETCLDQISPLQSFVYDSKSGYLKTDENICLDSGSDPMPTRQVMLAPCSESIRQKWKHTNESQIVHVKSGLCLDSTRKEKVSLNDCNPNNESLKWIFVDEQWNSHV